MLDVLELREAENSDVCHYRCIVTEHGCVRAVHGIGVSGDELHTDEVILMKPKIYQKKWQQFIEKNCFEKASEARS